ncbi:1790_t:CDS:2, partial [Racocetra persica]
RGSYWALDFSAVETEPCHNKRSLKQYYLLAQGLEGNASISQQTMSYTSASISNIAAYDTNSHVHVDEHNATAFSEYSMHQIYYLQISIYLTDINTAARLVKRLRIK